MANKELRELRIKAHVAIDEYWKDGSYMRNEVYKKLSDYFGYEFHVGEADEKMCEEVVNAIDTIFG